MKDNRPVPSIMSLIMTRIQDEHLIFFFIFWSTEQGTHDVIQECKLKCSEDQTSSSGSFQSHRDYFY